MPDNMLNLFRSFRTILCICPHCDALQRLGDLQLRYSGKVGKTWLDEHEANLSDLDGEVAKFEEEEEMLREKARERGRQQVPIILKKLIHTELTRQPFDPYDIKALLHPVDFIVFDGMNSGNTIKDITFLSRKAENRSLAELRGSIKTAVGKGSFDWKVARVDVEGSIEYGSK